MYQQAFNEPDVYETSDLPEDDQAQFESVSDTDTRFFFLFICKWIHQNTLR